MDLFKFNSNTSPTFFERGEMVNGYDKAMWVERYSTPGEFLIEAPLSSKLREFLPEGTIISHFDTREVMIVENHEIAQSDDDPIVVITGRSFPSFFENRIVGTNLARDDALIVPYILASEPTWDQIVDLMNEHILDTFVPEDEISDITVVVGNVPLVGTSEQRNIGRGTVLEEVEKLLKIDDLGIKTVRRNSSNPDTEIVIYQGEDKSSSVMFSWKSGDLNSANYLFSLRAKKTSAMVVGQYIYVVVDGPEENYDRRMMIVDASDIDGNFGSVPGPLDIPTLSSQMEARGREALSKQNQITITQTDVSETTLYHYRRDYNIGDLVTLDGNFNQTAVMRVVEYAEIEDENGESGHPTLAIPGT